MESQKDENSIPFEVMGHMSLKKIGKYKLGIIIILIIINFK